VGEILTIEAIKQVIVLILELFLPSYKKHVFNLGLIFENSHGGIIDISLVN